VLPVRASVKARLTASGYYGARNSERADARAERSGHVDGVTRAGQVSSERYRVLVVGGGVAGLETVLALREVAGDRVEVELIASEHRFFYRPLSVLEPFGRRPADHWELADLTRVAGARYTPGELAGLDVEAHTAELTSGQRIAYSAVVLATGARPEAALPGALTFRGPADTDRFRRLVDEVRAGGAKRLVFAVPSGIVWPLPIYELAFLTATELEREGTQAQLAIVTSEPSPLALFGRTASEHVARLLHDRGIALHLSIYPNEVAEGVLRCVPETDVAADHVVAPPRLRGPGIHGVPSDRNGFVPTDLHGRIRGAPDVFAAGDLTTFPIKQGGLAAQQADAVAEAIAADAGVPMDPEPFRPVLRALLVTGKRPTYLQVELRGGHGEAAKASSEPLWWQQGKIVGRWLAPLLDALGLLDDLAEPDEADVVRIEADSALHELLLNA
jgi:sulfide:quinone oxidoreductase